MKRRGKLLKNIKRNLLNVAKIIMINRNYFDCSQNNSFKTDNLLFMKKKQLELKRTLGKT